MKNLIVLTGAGISAESGISTFRDANGLWEGYSILEVASPEGWKDKPNIVNEFYNLRRAQLKTVKPNLAHKILAELEIYFNVTIITQNVDNLHEQAGSTNVIHLHGELNKVRPENNENIILDWTENLTENDLHNGSRLRPHIVWIGENILEFEKAKKISTSAHIYLIIGTSLQVFPAAGLYLYATPACPVIYIDTNPDDEVLEDARIFTITDTATNGLAELKQKLIEFTKQ